MADLRLFAKQNSVQRGAGWVGARATLDGSAVQLPWVAALALEGRVFSATVGSLTTPISFAKTAYDSDQPQFVLDVPASKAVIPLGVLLHLEDAAGTDNEVYLVLSTTQVGAGTSTAVTPKNARTDSPASSACSAYSLYTGNGTDPTIHSEIWRAGYAFADATNDPAKIFTWSANDTPLNVVVGTGSLVIYIVGTTTAPAGYLKVVWAEMDKTDITA